MKNPPVDSLITCKEIAILTGLSTRCVQRNEKRWGLAEARVQFNSRLIRYSKNKTVAALGKLGFSLPA